LSYLFVSSSPTQKQQILSHQQHHHQLSFILVGRYLFVSLCLYLSI
jgi:hypothetical protein